jgi:hypothetical protein
VIRRAISVGPADDELEKEARETAAHASASSQSAPSSGGAGGGKEDVAAQGSTDPPDTVVDDDMLVPEDEVQMKPAAAAPPGASSPAARLEARLATAGRSGQPLDAAGAASMGAAFGADFGDVRVHVDAEAAELASSIGAYAFTHGTHIYFGAGAFQPTTHHGRRLLAHELTHVVQQRPEVRLSRPPGGAEAEVDSVVRRAGPRRRTRSAGRDQLKGRVIGNILVLDRESEEIVVQSTFLEPLSNPAHLEPGGYDATAREEETLEGKSVVVLTIGTKSRPLSSMGDKGHKFRNALLNPKNRILVVVVSPGGTADTDLPKKATGPGANKPPPEDEKGDGKKKERTGEKGGDEKGQEGGKKDASGRKGSKYGWLGLYHLPDWLTDPLEAVLDALDESKEYLALKETLQSLQEMWLHRDELVAMFSSAENLLDVALGLRESEGVNKLAEWAMAAPPAPNPAIEAPTENRKGIAALAKRVLHLVAKVRRAAKPVFVARQRFMEVFEGLLALIAEVPAIEEVFDAGNDIGDLGQKLFDKYAKRASQELGKSIQDKLEAAGKTVKLLKEQFTERDFVSKEDIARAVVAAVELAVPAKVKRVAKALNLDDLIAKNVVAPAVPQEAVDGVNDVIHRLAKTLEPAVSQAEKTVMTMLGKVGDEFAKEFPKDLGDLFSAPVQRDQRAGGAAGGERAAGRALERADGLLRSSSGEPLPPDVRAEMQDRLGFSFDDVRVHTGGDAAAAADLLGANALTQGRNIYFGAGRFAPATADGRRLLAHELTHVVQQRAAGADAGDAAAADNVVQRDADFLVERARLLAKKMSAKAREKLKEGLKIATLGSPEIQAQARKSRDWATGMVKGNQKVKRKGDPPLAPGYSYVPRGKGRLTIRRQLKYLRYLPGLTITKDGLIRFGIVANINAELARARAELGRNMSCGEKEQAHHIIPLENRHHKVVEGAISAGWNQNGKENGICLSTDVHKGSHPKYTDRITAQLNAAANDLRRRGKLNVPAAARKEVEEIVEDHHEMLSKRTEKLD